MLPELYPSLGDITKLGVEYNRTNPDGAEYVFASFPLEDLELKSFYVRVVMAAVIGEAMGQFEISGVFGNYFGTIVRRFDVDKVTNPDNPDSKFFFRINGTVVEIICVSGFNDPSIWSGTIAIIGLS